MSDPIVHVTTAYDYIPGVNKITQTVRKFFDYKTGNDVVTVERYEITLYNKNAELKNYDSKSTIDKMV
jgi:hypothetical protein